MLRALTHKVSPRIAECEVTFIDRSPIDLRLAVLQHDHYCDVLKGLGVTVKKLSENGSYPDSCFVEDTAIVVDELAIIFTLEVSSLRGGTSLINQELSIYQKTLKILLPPPSKVGTV